MNTLGITSDGMLVLLWHSTFDHMLAKRGRVVSAMIGLVGPPLDVGVAWHVVVEARRNN